MWLWLLLAQNGGNIKLTNPITGTDAPSLLGVGGIWITAARGIVALSGVAAVVMLLWAGFNWLTSGGEKEKTATARQTVVWVLIGLVVIVSAYAFLNTLISILTNGLNFTQ